MTRTERQHRARRGRRVHGLAALGASAVIVLTGVVAACTGSVPTTAPYVAPAASTRVGGALAAAPAASGKPAGDVSTVTSTQPAPVSATSSVGRFVVASAGLNVALESQPYSASLTPAGFTSAYEAQGSGWGADGQPRLITLHSCSARTDCPGNALTQGGVSTVGIGDVIEVDGRSYAISSTEVRNKDAISASPAWTNMTSASLVIVTCSPDGHTHAVSNLLIRAELQP